MKAWSRLGLRGRLALAIAALVLLAFGAVFFAVRAQMSDESQVIDREEAREHGDDDHEGVRGRIQSISDAQHEVEETFFVVGGIALLAALGGGVLLAARTASPLRRMAATAAEVRGGNLDPRLREEPRSPPELRTLVDAFNSMLERLDAAFRGQRRFVSDASHELRTPLTAIRGQLEVLAREPEPDGAEVRRVTAVTLAELGRVERLVEDLLSLARLDEGAGARRQRLALAGLLRELAAVDPARPELGELAAGEVRADPDLIARVVRNLLANARRAAGESGRVLLAAVAAGERLQVEVDDDGPGVPAHERERVFERFHRTDEARASEAGGSGLGLAISRAIVEAHGGRIWIAESPLGGARVSFELPLAGAGSDRKHL